MDRAIPRAREYAYPELDAGGLYQWRARGESPYFQPRFREPPAARGSQHSDLTRDYRALRPSRGRRSRSASARSAGMLAFRYADEPIPLEEVEPAEADS